MDNFIQSYLSYASASSETPMIFHRWSCMAGLGALLGRRYNLSHGHFTLQPNLYCMLIGTPGTRKSSGIKIMKNLLIKTGYNTFAAEKTTKEKFLLDLAGDSGELGTKVGERLENLLDNNLWDEPNGGADAEMFIAADEFNDFITNGNMEFISLLGSLWDYSGIYTNRIKNGKSVAINNPTINILGGNTPTSFANAFPADVFGQGFFSRLILVYGESSGKRIAFPEPPDKSHEAELLRLLETIKTQITGSAVLDKSAKSLLEKIYNQPSGFDDIRFESFSTRRFTHLLKLCLVTSASRYSTRITEDDVIHANTILSYTEQFMPKALGEFGRAKNADVTHKVLQIIYNNPTSTSFKEIWSQVSSDLENMQMLSGILGNLLQADKIQKAGDTGNLLPMRKILIEADAGSVDWSLLTNEERSSSK